MVFPEASVELCIVHMVRHSLNFVGWKERKQVAEDLRRIYSAITIEKAEMELRQFEEKWGPIGTYRRRLVEELASLNDVH